MNEYTCSMCAGTFETDWTDDEAMAEAEANGFANVPLTVVCDDCYQALGLPVHG